MSPLCAFFVVTGRSSGKLTGAVVLIGAVAGFLSYALVNAVQNQSGGFRRRSRVSPAAQSTSRPKLDESGDDNLPRWLRLQHIHGQTRALAAGDVVASHVATTAGMLTQGAEESARVQMAEAIQQIAAGSQDQSDSASKTAMAVDELGKAISQVAEGTDAQTAGLHESLTVASNADHSLAQVMNLLERTGIASNKNAEYASRGSQAVSKVLNNMESIKSTTRNIAQNIREPMGIPRK